MSAEATPVRLSIGSDELSRQVLQWLSAPRPPQLLTGFRVLDEVLCAGALAPENLVIIAARPAVGKTAFAQALAENISAQGRTVLYASLEMSARALFWRYAWRHGAAAVPVPREEDMHSIYEAARAFAQHRIRWLDSPAIYTLQGLLNALREEAAVIQAEAGAPPVVFVDHIGLVEVPGAGTRVDRVSEVTRSLKNLAKELFTPIVALSQLNRAIEASRSPGQPPRRAGMADLRDSGSVEQDADVIMFLHRDDYGSASASTAISVHDLSKPDVLREAAAVAVASRRAEIVVAKARDLGREGAAEVWSDGLRWSENERDFDGLRAPVGATRLLLPEAAKAAALYAGRGKYVTAPAPVQAEDLYDF